MAQLHDEHNLKSCHNLQSFQSWQKRFLALVHLIDHTIPILVPWQIDKQSDQQL